jgi:hypothetical protein
MGEMDTSSSIPLCLPAHTRRGLGAEDGYEKVSWPRSTPMERLPTWHAGQGAKHQQHNGDSTTQQTIHQVHAGSLDILRQTPPDLA